MAIVVGKGYFSLLKNLMCFVQMHVHAVDPFVVKEL
jgi:hypothetical protein